MRIYLYVIISAILGIEPFTPLERALEKKLMDRIAGLEVVRVRIQASRFLFLIFGLCKRVTIEMRGLRVESLCLDAFSIESESFRLAPFMTFVLNNPRIISAGITKWDIRVLDKDLEEFFRSRGPILRGMEVRIDPECVTLRRSSDLTALLKLREPLSVCGKLILSEKKDVLLDIDHFSAFGIGPNRPLLKTALKIVNPILTSDDLTRFLSRATTGPLEKVKLKAAFENIKMDAGHVDISGEIFAAPITAGNNNVKGQKNKKPFKSRKKNNNSD
jgi:hypothetical protein